MNPSRRDILGTLAAAGAATLVDPGEVLARIAANVPCATPTGELLALLPLVPGSVAGAAVRREDQRLGPRRAARHGSLDPRAQQADHAQRAGLHSHRDPGRGRRALRSVDHRRVGPARQRRRAEARRPGTQLEEDGPAPVRMLGQRQPVELRPDERGRMGRHSARRRRGTPQAHEGSDRCSGQRLRSHRPESRSDRSSAPAGCFRSRRSTSSARSSRSR